MASGEEKVQLGSEARRFLLDLSASLHVLHPTFTRHSPPVASHIVSLPRAHPSPSSEAAALQTIS